MDISLGRPRGLFGIIIMAGGCPVNHLRLKICLNFTSKIRKFCIFLQKIRRKQGKSKLAVGIL